MNANRNINEPYVFRDTILNRALHFDFIRLRCGSERRFFDGINSLQLPPPQRPRAFIAFAEWDAVMITPSNELYPPALNAVYGSETVVATFAGTSGYFTYLWDHPVNKGLEQKLDTFAKSGLAIVMSLRFNDAFRTELGLGGELLFCDFLQRLTQETSLSGLVAHTLGWNDVVVVLHAPSDEQRLTAALARIRLATFRDLIGAEAERLFSKAAGDAVFAASYSHLIAGSAGFLNGDLSMGSLAAQLQSATLLVRVMPPLEQKVREHIASRFSVPIERMPSEMGHYSFSVDLSRVASGNDGRDALRLIASVREFIGSADEFAGSYAETSTIFCFREPPAAQQPATDRVPGEVASAIETVCALMNPLSERLQSRGASPMTIHRFLAVLTTLVDHLSDPVRSSVVRHLARFLAQATEIISELNRDQIEDLCHICEYAMTQAIDGIAQFQHDANALGLTGRGGYNRLILAIEMYVQDVLDSLRVHKDVLITFGLRTGHAGAAGRFQIDIPFNVLFVPSRWYVLLHEAGHIAWVESFGWMGETLATYDQLHREILSLRPDMLPEKRELATRVEFLRTREIIRELFPNLLVYRIACGEDLTEFDRLSVRRMVASSGIGQGARELQMVAVLHALFAVIRDSAAESSVQGRAWWAIWTPMENKQLLDLAHQAADAIAAILSERGGENAGPAGPHQQMLVNSAPFREAVAEALESTIKVLGLSARDFTRGEEHDPDLAERLFRSLQEGIDIAVDEQRDYAVPQERFAQWLIDGEVLALAPGAHIWARLLHFSYQQLKESKKEGAFMLSQLSVILSLWHRAVTTTASNELRSAQVLYYPLKDLQLVKQKAFSG